MFQTPSIGKPSMATRPKHALEACWQEAGCVGGWQERHRCKHGAFVWSIGCEADFCRVRDAGPRLTVLLASWGVVLLTPNSGWSECKPLAAPLARDCRCAGMQGQAQRLQRPPRPPLRALGWNHTWTQSRKSLGGGFGRWRAGGRQGSESAGQAAEGHEGGDEGDH